MIKDVFRELLIQIQAGNRKALARSISLAENEVPGYESFMRQLPPGLTPVIGITGPPGAGKSTLVDALIGYWTAQGKSIGVLCVDPSSPFNLGALLGDRVRMSDWYNHPHVYIRSLATRGSLGGLHPKIIEITDIMKAGGFDYLVLETVGVGQSEVEIAGLADCTVVVLVPEAGDEIQTMKAGLMEIADIFAVNKADRPGAGTFIKNLRLMLSPGDRNTTPTAIVPTMALQKKGIEDLVEKIENFLSQSKQGDRKLWLLAEKAHYLIQVKRMKDVPKALLRKEIEEVADFNLYRYVQSK